MMRNGFRSLLIVATLGIYTCIMNQKVLADNSLSSTGSVTIKGSETSEIIDPEEPEEIIDPGPGPSTKGNLRFDFVSALDFSTVKVGKTNRNFEALAVPVNGGQKQRGSFVQITDVRSSSKGWTLQVKQMNQFVTPDHDELTGAVLSLDKAWANSPGISKPPTVTRDTLALENIGVAYEVARAGKDEGVGIWSIVFGASKDNPKNQPITLKEVDGKTRNSAVQLKVPDATNVVAKEYQTKMTWILSQVP